MSNCTLFFNPQGIRTHMFRIVNLSSIAFVHNGMVFHITFFNPFQFSKGRIKRDVSIAEIGVNFSIEWEHSVNTSLKHVSCFQTTLLYNVLLKCVKISFSRTGSKNSKFTSCFFSDRYAFNKHAAFALLSLELINCFFCFLFHVITITRTDRVLVIMYKYFLPSYDR